MKRFNGMRMCLMTGLLLAVRANAVSLSPLFSDGAVMQRKIPVPVWGAAEPGETVTVTFAEQIRKTQADANGNWKIVLEPMPASAEPRILTVTGEKTGVTTVSGLLVGEVWLCSGQSNMGWTLKNSAGGTEAAAQAPDPLLRLFRVPNVMSDTPTPALSGRWMSSESPNALGFSGVAFFFGRDLRNTLGVPVGLIQSAWGGTPAEAWTARPVMEAVPVLREILDWYAKIVAEYTPEKGEQEYQKTLEGWSNQVVKAQTENLPAPARPQQRPPPAESPFRPGCLYNAMLHPLIPYAMAGVIWYQGEANAGAYRAKQYETLFPAMVESWRQEWNQGVFPFLYVQIAPYQGMTPEIREAQLVCLKAIPNSAMAVTTDVGEEKSIHPIRKEPVGARLALAARALAYGEKVLYSGPIYRSMQVDGNRAVLDFDFVGSGLVAKEGGLQNFEIAAAGTTNFVPATATIEGSRVIVQSPVVPVPGSVRYGWRNWFEGSLFNKEGLPASPFRTERKF